MGQPEELSFLSCAHALHSATSRMVLANFLNGICVITLMGFEHRKRGGINPFGNN